MPESLTPSHRVRVDALDVIVQDVIAALKLRGTTPELPTGLPLLDKAIWGLHRGEVTILAARPGEGKTSMALQIAYHLAQQGKRVLFVSLEMSREQLVERLLVQITQVDAWTLRTGQDLAPMLERLGAMNGLFKTLKLRVVDGIGYTMSQLQHLLNEVAEHAGGAPDVLVLDFIQLIALEHGMQKFDAIAEYLRSLKELGVRYNMATLICSQINRESGKNAKSKPRLENLKGSGSLEELADCVLMCWWQELGTEENPQGLKYWLLVEKQRNGPPGQMIPMRFDKEKLTFYSAEEPIAGWVGTSAALPKEESDGAPF